MEGVQQSYGLPRASTPSSSGKVVINSAAAFQLAFSFHEARTATELEKTFSEIPQFRPEMLVVLNDPFMFSA